MSFIHEDFLLQSDTAKFLYHEFAESCPILDYHNHLPPEDIANNRQFANLHEIWLEGDHYKWRAMRTNGESEELITGDADPYDKFLAFARTVPHTVRNPIYHWTHLELKRFFGIDTLLNEATAKEIWEETEKQLSQPEMSTQGILEDCQVKALCTTDDPTSDLKDHIAIAESDCKTKVYPTFRPDKALTVDDPAGFKQWCSELEKLTSTSITSLDSLKEALRQRHDFFHSIGGRLSDHGLGALPKSYASATEGEEIFQKAINGTSANETEKEAFTGHLMHFFGILDAEKNWTKQLHLGAMRNNNKRLFDSLGPDTGFDSIGDYSQGETLSGYLSKLDETDQLPRTVIYNLNPRDNYLFATMTGNFMDGSIPGKIQFGSGWWFLDQKEGMESQLNALSNCGLLTRFVGMLTDSRSFMSFPRHEYFRRIMCQLLGEEIDQGLIPNDNDLVGSLIKNVCYQNALEFTQLEV